ncbi:MAG: flavin reductase family protein [Bacilli bacterium]|nr:flavin reductase family protein [Bacilli bacterium]
MRKNLGSKPLSYPQVVFIIAAYDENGKPNAMNAAWGGISEEKEVSMCLSNNHKTVKDIEVSKAFTVSFGTASLVKECDYLGIVSGNKESNKLGKANLHTVKSELVNAPIIEEFPICLECKLISYDRESCIMKGEIVNVSVDERVIGENGKVDVKKVEPIAFDPFNGTYIKFTEVVDNAFRCGLEISKK